MVRFSQVILVASAVFFGFCLPVNANFLEDAWGVVTDPFKIGRGSDNAVQAVERAAIHADRIQEKLNANAEARLNQLGDIIRETRNGLDQTIDNAFVRINEAQGKFMLATAELIKCSTEVSSEIIKTKLSESLNDLGKRKPRFDVFGYTFGEVKLDTQDIKSPLESFREIKVLYDKRIAEVQPSDHPSKITDIYADLARLAELTRCHYQKDSSKWLELYNEYELENIRKQKSWSGLVKPI